MPKMHILLIDDHALFRTGLAMVLKDRMPGVAIEQRTSLEDALQSAQQTPELVLLDVQLQGLSGLDGIGLVKQRWPSSVVVMLSSMAEPRTTRMALERGAAAFLSKADTTDNIVSVIRSLLRGDDIAAIANPTGACSGSASSHTAASSDEAADAQQQQQQQRLTPRQSEVLDLVCQGLSNKVIARRLNLSENTVRGHVQATLGALGVSSRTEAAFAARRSGLLL